MMRSLLATAAAAVLLASCGTDGGTTATDPTTPTGSATEPTAVPTVGTYPAYEPANYTYQLSVTCFCVGAGVPIEVTVEDAEVVGAVYLADDGGRGGTKEGDRADKFHWLTINDVIDTANDTGAARVDVDWPKGQEYPNSVYIDRDLNTVDEEVGYQVSHVRTS